MGLNSNYLKLFLDSKLPTRYIVQDKTAKDKEKKKEHKVKYFELEKSFSQWVGMNALCGWVESYLPCFVLTHLLLSFIAANI